MNKEVGKQIKVLIDNIENFVRETKFANTNKGHFENEDKFNGYMDCMNNLLYQLTTITSGFTHTCNRCGSNDVSIDCEEDWDEDYDGEWNYNGSTLTIFCKSCGNE